MQESRAVAILRNYGAILTVFTGFALVVVIVDALTRNQTVSYLAGVAVVGLAWVATGVLRVSVARGFLPYCFVFLLCTAAFPASDVITSAYVSTILYVGFLGMMTLTVALLWRAVTHR